MVLNDRSSTDRTAEDYSRLIAIVGMAGRFPGSSNVDQFWENLVQGRETTTRFTPEELKHAGLPDWVIQDPDYVPVRGVIEEVESFDAAFFGYSPREAEILDPQQRVFLEVAYTALENAGYDPGNCPGSVGVFAGENQNSYLLFNVIDSDEALSGIHALAIHEDKDFLATRGRLGGHAHRLQAQPEGARSHLAMRMFDVSGLYTHGMSVLARHGVRHGLGWRGFGRLSPCWLFLSEGRGVCTGWALSSVRSPFPRDIRQRRRRRGRPEAAIRCVA